VHAPTIVYDAADDSLVRIASQHLQQDVESVSGKKLPVATKLGLAKNIILIGNLQKSRFIQQLVAEKKLSVTVLQNRWEGYKIQVVKAPFKGVAQALVIVGSDRRGAAFGTFELSKQIGVSPWHWWADVPAQKASQLYVQPGAVLVDSPKVKYRGIFINDEAPALSNWSREKFGGFNHKFYEKVFELILRLKGNYLWPAMWGNAFYDDDPQNRQVADNYGVVIGTSHHEPLMRAHDEWRRHGKGKWNYDSNAVALQQFWKEGMQRATNEKIVSVGMRGDGDEPMSRETATALLERIVTDQRQIIADVTRKPATETPQLWALYKEVQDYYDKGMRVPDDVTLLLADDNWGNIRRLPKLTDPKRAGGHGIYYHFDYVGGPRNYKWLNTNNLARVWEQMHLAWRHGVDRIWIVNVGDIKPMELP
ncbi:MAG: glycosyhydrolase, partial [Chitinophagaceae bacterium]